MITINSGCHAIGLDTLEAAIKKSKTIPQVCRAIGWNYSPTADYNICEAIKKYCIDASHFVPRRERKPRVLGSVHTDTKEMIDEFVESIPRPDSKAAYKYILYNFAEALNGESILYISPETIERFLSTLPNESKQKYTASCVKAAFAYAFKNIPKSKAIVSKDLLFWILGV